MRSVHQFQRKPTFALSPFAIHLPPTQVSAVGKKRLELFEFVLPTDKPSVFGSESVVDEALGARERVNAFMIQTQSRRHVHLDPIDSATHAGQRTLDGIHAQL